MTIAETIRRNPPIIGRNNNKLGLSCPKFREIRGYDGQGKSVGMARSEDASHINIAL